jgi:hypothetical protein
MIGAKDIPVFARDAMEPTGLTTGGTRHCALEGCTGLRIGVRWDNGRLTYPCSKGMTSAIRKGAYSWRIL